MPPAIRDNWNKKIGSRIAAVPISSAGDIIACGDAEGNLRHFDIAGNLRWEKQPGGSISAVSMSAAGELTAIIMRGGIVVAFDSSGNQLWKFEPEMGADRVAVSADASIIAVAESAEERLSVLDRSGKTLWSKPAADVSRLAVASDSNSIVLADEDGKVMIYTDAGQLQGSFSLPSSRITCMHLPMGAKEILLGVEQMPEDFSGDDEHHLYSIDQTGSILYKFATEGIIQSIDSAPAASRVLVGSSDRYAYCIDTSGKELWRFQNKYAVEHTRLGPEGKRAFVGSWFHVFGLDERGEMLWKYEASGVISDLNLSADGRYVVASCDDRNNVVNDKYVYLLDANSEIVEQSETVSGVMLDADLQFDEGVTPAAPVGEAATAAATMEDLSSFLSKEELATLSGGPGGSTDDLLSDLNDDRLEKQETSTVATEEIEFDDEDDLLSAMTDKKKTN